MSLLLCHLNTHAIALKVQCCDFVISVLELDPPGIKQQDMIASEFLRLGEHPKKVSSEANMAFSDQKEYDVKEEREEGSI